MDTPPSSSSQRSRRLNMGSTVMTSGSVKYVVGAPPGPKSRGGVVTVLGGAVGPGGGPWADTMAGASAMAPAVAPMAVSSERRDRYVRWSMGGLLRRKLLAGTVAEGCGHRNRAR